MNRTSDQINCSALGKLNTTWASAKELPFWKSLKMPDSFQSLDEYLAIFPIITKDDVRKSIHEMINSSIPKVGMASTGGSTGKPLQFPVSQAHRDIAKYNQINARRHYNITKNDKLFLIWGHSDRMELSTKAWINIIRRKIADRLLGYTRVSAYDLSIKSLRQYGEIINSVKPNWIYGYASALVALARANTDRKLNFHALKLKAVICSSEILPPEDSKLLSDVFGAPIAEEYGAMETGPIAFTRPDSDGFNIFSESHYVDYQSTSDENIFNINITLLYPSIFPLFRYSIGDQVVRHRNSCVDFDQVLGRSNDNLTLPDGTVLHSEVFAHAIRPEPHVVSFQVHLRDGRITIYYVASGEENGMTSRVRERLSKVSRELIKISFRRVENLESTSSGKTRWILQNN